MQGPEQAVPPPTVAKKIPSFRFTKPLIKVASEAVRKSEADVAPDDLTSLARPAPQGAADLPETLIGTKAERDLGTVAPVPRAPRAAPQGRGPHRSDSPDR